MALSEEDKQRVEGMVRQMIAEYRARPTQQKEDGLGVEIAAMQPPEREYVTTVLLRIVAAERGGRGSP